MKKKQIFIIEESRFLLNSNELENTKGGNITCGTTVTYHNCPSPTNKTICTEGFNVVLCRLYDMSCETFYSCGGIRNMICETNTQYVYGCTDKLAFR